MTTSSRPRRPFQIFFIGYGSLIQAVYALFGVLIAVLALLPPLRAYYKQA